MPFKLVIRHNIGDDSDEFTGADVRHFDETDVSVGCDADCNCALDYPEEFLPRHFHIRFDEDDGYLLVPEKNATVFHNRKPVYAAQPLTSGDEIRVGHLVFRFQKEYRAARAARRTNLLEILAKVIIAGVLVLELYFIYWLPRRIQSERLLASSITRQQTVMLLDSTRQKARHMPRETGGFAQHATALILDELDRMAVFIRENEKEISDAQWQWFFNTTGKLNNSLHNIRAGTLEKPLPKPALEDAVKAVIQDAKENLDE